MSEMTIIPAIQWVRKIFKPKLRYLVSKHGALSWKKNFMHPTCTSRDFSGSLRVMGGTFVLWGRDIGYCSV